jgi:hypothetical protein
LYRKGGFFFSILQRALSCLRLWACFSRLAIVFIILVFAVSFC